MFVDLYFFKLKNLFFACLFISKPLILFAQNNNKVSFGVAFDFATKYSSEAHLGFVAYEPSIYIRVEGVQQNSLSFTGRVGLLFDPLRVDYGSGNRFSIVQHNFSFSGLINFPVKNEHWKILAGIGVELCDKPGISYGTHGNSYSGAQNQSYLSIDLDSTEATLETYRRRVLPSISAGISYRPPLGNKKLSISLMLKQNLLQLFTEDINIAVNSNGYYNNVSINYKPSYLKLGLSYDLL